MDEPTLPDPPVIPSDEIIWIGGNIDRVSVSLRFFGDDLAPEKVSGQLECQPSVLHRKGDMLASKRYRRVAKTGTWRLQISKDDVGTLEEKIHRLLDSVTSELTVWEDLKRFQHDVFCGLQLAEWNRGCSLSPPLMRRLSERDRTLELDIYCDSSEEE